MADHVPVIAFIIFCGDLLDLVLAEDRASGRIGFIDLCLCPRLTDGDQRHMRRKLRPDLIQFFQIHSSCLLSSLYDIGFSAKIPVTAYESCDLDLGGLLS